MNGHLAVDMGTSFVENDRGPRLPSTPTAAGERGVEADPMTALPEDGSERETLLCDRAASRPGGFRAALPDGPRRTNRPSFRTEGAS